MEALPDTNGFIRVYYDILCNSLILMLILKLDIDFTMQNIVHVQVCGKNTTIGSRFGNMPAKSDVRAGFTAKIQGLLL